MKKLLYIISLAITFNAFTTAQAEVYKVNQGKVKFVAKGFPTFITITGKGNGLTGEMTEDGEKTSGKFALDLTSLSTDLDLRDEHMKNKYLEVAKFPKAMLTLPIEKLSDSGEIKAILKLKDVEKEIPVQYEISSENGNKIVKTNFKIELSDFNIEIPSFQGVTVAKTINLDVEFKAISKK